MSKVRTRQVTCKICFKETPMPASNPAFGSHLVCDNCRGPLVSVSRPKGRAPLSVSAAVLRRTTGFSGRCLIHPVCPWCREVNYAMVAPAEGRAYPWLAEKEPQNPRAFSLETKCVHCDKAFCIEWDVAPLPMNCALCGARMRVSDRWGADQRFCAKCGPKLSLVRARRRKEPPLGDAVECVFLVGFSRTPAEREAAALRSLDKEIGQAPIARLMLSGGVPASTVETEMITVNLASTAAPKALGHDVDLKKVSYQGFRSALVVKVWK